MADLKAFAEQLVNLTVKEVQELATILKDEYGIEPAAAAVAVAAPGAGGGAGAAAEEEKTAFDVILKNPGGNKLAIVKLVKPSPPKPSAAYEGAFLTNTVVLIALPNSLM